MEKKEQRQFINELVDNVKAEILQYKYPETWDGIELRWLIKEKFKQVVFGGYGDKRTKRYKNFENDCIVNNWY